MRQQSSKSLYFHNPAIDLMKITAIIAVVFIHATAATTFTFELSSRSSWWSANLISSFSRWSVPIFVMASGALLLNQKKYRSIKNFFCKRALRLIPALIFWIIIYSIFYHFVRFDPLSFAYTLRRIIFDQPYEHLYFLFVMLELAILTPVIHKLQIHMSDPQFTVLSIMSVIISIFWVPHRFVATIGIPFIGYYLLGRILFTKSPKIPQKLLWFLVVSTTAAIAIGTFLFVSHLIPNQDGLYFYTYFNPLVIILSCAMFLIFLQYQTLLSQHWVGKIKILSQMSYGIYLIHPIFLYFFMQLLGSFALPYIFYLTVVVISTILASAVLTRLMQKLPLLRYTL